jgi:hypothetical protein
LLDPSGPALASRSECLTDLDLKQPEVLNVRVSGAAGGRTVADPTLSQGMPMPKDDAVFLVPRRHVSIDGAVSEEAKRKLEGSTHGIKLKDRRMRTRTGLWHPPSSGSPSAPAMP